MDRRRYLRVSACAVASGLAGCMTWGRNEDGGETRSQNGTQTQTSRSPPDTTTTRTATETDTETQTQTETRTATSEPEFGTVVDAVADLGCDKTGEKPSHDKIKNAIADDTLIEFPPGRYLVEEPIIIEENISFGIRGTGAGRRDVQFAHPKGFSDYLFNVRVGRDCLFENFTADQTDDRKTNSGMVFLQNDGLLVRDVEVKGFTPTNGGTKDLIVQMTSKSGFGVVQRYVSKGGGQVGVYPNSYAGFYSGRQHHGTLRLIDCHIEECGSNGVYASRTYGPVQIEGGLFKNNAVSQVRISGEGSYLRNATLVIDTNSATKVAGKYDSVRGLWWESGWQGKTGGVVENTEFIVKSANQRRGLVEIDGTAGAMTLRNCEFQIDWDKFWGFISVPPGVSSMGGTPPRPWNLTIKDSRITGSASYGTDIQIDGRRHTTIDGLTINHSSGQKRDGIYLSNCYGSELINSSCRTYGYPLWLYTDESVPDADYLLHLGQNVTLSQKQGTRPASIDPLFESDTSSKRSGVYVPNPEQSEYSVVIGRSEDDKYFGFVRDSPPEYHAFTRQ